MQPKFHQKLLYSQKIDPELVLPNMRVAVEKQLNSIAKGVGDYKTILKNAVELYRWKFLYFVQNIEAMDALFEGQFSPLAESGKAFSRCGKCRRYMKYIEVSSNFPNFFISN